MDKKSPQRTEPQTITEGAMELISQVARELDSCDRMEILSGVCDVLETRWPSKSMEQRLQQMGLQTTGKILYVIDVYLAGVSHGFLG